MRLVCPRKSLVANDGHNAKADVLAMCRTRSRADIRVFAVDKSTERGEDLGVEVLDGEASASTADMNCVGGGMDVVCSVPDSKPNDAMERGPADVNLAEDPSTSSPLIASLASTLVLISPFFFWGTSMVAMKVVAPHSTPLFTAAVRLIPAGASVVAYALATGRKSPATLNAWLACAAFGLVDGTIFQGCLALGLQRTAAGLGSVIIDSQPLTVALAAALFLGEELTAAGVAGLGLGIAGLLLLELPPESLTALASGDFGGVLSASGGGEWWESGELWMLFAAQAMALGTLMIPWVTRFVDPVMATGWHMLLGGAPLLGATLLTQPDELRENLSAIDAGDIALFSYTSLFGSALSYGVFFYIASKGNLTKLSSLTFLTPMFAAFSGWLVLQETLTPLQLAGASVTVLGVLLINAKASPKDEAQP